MRRPVFLLLGLAAVAAPPAAATPKILLVARDRGNHTLSALRFTSEGLESGTTNKAGATQLNLPDRYAPGQAIKIRLLTGPQNQKDWFLGNDTLNVPEGSASALVGLARP